METAEKQVESVQEKGHYKNPRHKHFGRCNINRDFCSEMKARRIELYLFEEV